MARATRRCTTCISAKRCTTRSRAITSTRWSGSTPSSANIAALDEPELDSLYYHLHDAEFSVGDFELNYRMHHRAGHAIKAVLEGAVDEQVRNEAAYRLARIHFQKDQLDDALPRSSASADKVPEGDPRRRRVPARERLLGVSAVTPTRWEC